MESAVTSPIEYDTSSDWGSLIASRRYSFQEEMALKQWAQKQHPPVVLDTDTDRRASQDSNDNRRPLMMRGKRRSKQARRMRLMSMYSEEMDSGGGGGGGGGQPVQNGTATNDYTKRPPSSNGQLTSPAAEKRTSVISQPAKAPSKLSGTDIAELSLTDLPWGARWLEFVEGVSIVGLRYAVDPQAGNVRRLVWGMFILLGVGFMIYQIFERSVSVQQNLCHCGKLTTSREMTSLCSVILTQTTKCRLNVGCLSCCLRIVAAANWLRFIARFV